MRENNAIIVYLMNLWNLLNGCANQLKTCNNKLIFFLLNLLLRTQRAIQNNVRYMQPEYYISGTSSIGIYHPVIRSSNYRTVCYRRALQASMGEIVQTASAIAQASIASKRAMTIAPTGSHSEPSVSPVTRTKNN